MKHYLLVFNWIAIKMQIQCTIRSAYNKTGNREMKIR